MEEEHTSVDTCMVQPPEVATMDHKARETFTQHCMTTISGVSTPN